MEQATRDIAEDNSIREMLDDLRQKKSDLMLKIAKIKLDQKNLVNSAGDAKRKQKQLKTQVEKDQKAMNERRKYGLLTVIVTISVCWSIPFTDLSQ